MPTARHTGGRRRADDAKAKLEAAETARASVKALKDHRRSIATGEQALQKAREAFARGEYLVAIEALGSIRPIARHFARFLEGLTSPPARRRR